MAGLLDRLDYLEKMVAPAGYMPSTGPPGGMSQPGPMAAGPMGAPPPPPAFQGTSDDLGGGPDQAPPAPPPGPPPGLLAAPPEEAPAPVEPHGLLGHLTATDSDGITFRDKLMALGSIMQGDGEGARSYLGTQREAATKAKAMADAKDMKRKQAQAFFGAMRPDGSLDLAKYAQLAGDAFDAGDAAKIAKDLDPSYEWLTPSGGGVFKGNKRTGVGEQVQAPPPPKPEKDQPGVWTDPATGKRGPDRPYIDAQVEIAKARAAAAAANRAPARGPAGPKPDQKMLDLAAKWNIKVKPKGS